ncbi:MAG TPA: GDSL-type esterase/lipase family protein [Bacillota bacterium]|nr:GDSL-type esterase/lipase family protein [Bacillota bacterium]
MKNILIFGASIVHGVGGARGGWVDKLKASLHRDMYGEDAAGEICELYELGIPGATVADVLRHLDAEAAARLERPGCTPEESYIVILCGHNDSKAINEPGNFATSTEDFEHNAGKLLDSAQKHAKHVIVAGLSPVDEHKVSPKINPFNGSKSYFTNDRLAQFEAIWKKVCDPRKITFVPIHAAAPEDWASRYMFTDGVHPDDKGHEWLRTQIEPVLRKELGDWLDD